MERCETSRVIELLGKRIIIDVWKCYDRYITRYGRASDIDNFAVDIKITSIKDKVIVRIGKNNSMVSVITSNLSKEANIKIIDLDGTEVIMEDNEVEKVFKLEQLQA